MDRQRRLIILTRLLTAFLLLMSTGCHLARKKPVPLSEIYDHDAQLPDYVRNPVIVIPGILGSRLVDGETGDVAWGEFGPGAASARRPATLRELALPMQIGKPLSQLSDQVHEDGPLDRVVLRVFGISVRVNAYAQILSTLGVGGYRDTHLHGKSSLNEVNYGDEHFTCFQFSYDWRRDISETAGELDQYIKKAEAYTREQYRDRYGIEDADIKFDIVAHSMGGLLARYYLRYGDQRLPDDGSLPDLTWQGTGHVGRAFLVGTPNEGSTKSLTEMRDGMQLAPFIPKFPPAVLGTIPAVYQLLPRTEDHPLVTEKCESLDVLDPETWERLQWCLSDPKQDKTLQKLMPGTTKQQRREIALDHQFKCLVRARQLHDSLDLQATPPPGLELHLYAGDAVKTLDSIVVDASTGKIVEERMAAGDGTVTRTSALTQIDVAADEPARSSIPWTTTTFLSADHLGLTKDRAFVDNILHSLLHRVETAEADGYTEFSLPILESTQDSSHVDELSRDVFLPNDVDIIEDPTFEGLLSTETDLVP